MAYCIGIDEAGYGPNIGPLVIAATLWRVPDELPDDELYPALKKVVAKVPRAGKRPDKRLWLADSKAVYSTAVGLGNLELGVLTALAAAGLRPRTLRALLDDLQSGCHATLWDRPWHCDAEFAMPLAADEANIDDALARFGPGLAACGVELLRIQARVVFPCEYNSSIDRLANKSTLLTCESLGLVRSLLAHCEEGVVRVACDKHGGRNTYASALQEFVFDGLVQTVCEARDESVYRFRDERRSVEIGFRVGGENRLPTALASMTAKYVREVSMHAWNVFWRRHLPDLKPTAGYSVDSHRFRRDIEQTAAALNLPQAIWWRSR